MDDIVSTGIIDSMKVVPSGTNVPMMVSSDEVENFNSYKFYEGTGTVMINFANLSSFIADFNWKTDWKINGKSWWDVSGARVVDSDVGSHLIVRTAKNGKIVYRVHKTGGTYGWFEDKDKAIEFLYRIR